VIEFGVVVAGVWDVANRARRLEALGFDYVAVGEHVAFHTPTSNSFVSLAAAAAVTSTVRLLSSVTLLPLYPPPLVAKMGAALDVISGGRFSMGVGVGGENPAEFEACGVPLAERGARADEALAVISALWSGKPVDFAGRFTSFRGLRIDPAPVQRPRPPIWVSGRRAPARRRAARHGDGWMPYFVTPEQLRASYGEIAEACTALGRPVETVRRGVFLFVSCHRDREVARRRALERLGTQYAQDFEGILGKYAVLGTPDECQLRLKEFLDAGAESVFLSSACADDEAVEHERLVADEVISPLRERPKPRSARG
jgi:probable F420-dependent oxidoreductase